MNYFDAAVEAAGKIGIQEVSEDIYLGNAKRYVIVSVETEPEAFANDIPCADRLYITIGVYVPVEENTRKWDKSFRLALEIAGLENIKRVGTSYEEKKRTRHIIYTAEMAEAREEKWL